MICSKVFAILVGLCVFIRSNEAAPHEPAGNIVEKAVLKVLEVVIRNSPTDLVGKLAQGLSDDDLGKLVHQISPEAAGETLAHVSKSSFKRALETQSSDELNDLLERAPSSELSRSKSDVSTESIPSVITDLSYTEIGDIYAGETESVQVKLAKALSNKAAGEIVQNLPSSNLDMTAKELPKAILDAIEQVFHPHGHGGKSGHRKKRHGGNSGASHREEAGGP